MVNECPIAIVINKVSDKKALHFREYFAQCYARRCAYAGLIAEVVDLESEIVIVVKGFQDYVKDHLLRENAKALGLGNICPPTIDDASNSTPKPTISTTPSVQHDMEQKNAENYRLPTEKNHSGCTTNSTTTAQKRMTRAAAAAAAAAAATTPDLKRKTRSFVKQEKLNQNDNHMDGLEDDQHSHVASAHQNNDQGRPKGSVSQQDYPEDNMYDTQSTQQHLTSPNGPNGPTNYSGYSTSDIGIILENILMSFRIDEFPSKIQSVLNVNHERTSDYIKAVTQADFHELLVRKEILASIHALHTDEQEAVWEKVKKMKWGIPVNAIQSYFGSEITFYFAWLEFFTTWTIVPAILGLFMYLSILYRGTNVENDPYVMFFGFFIVLWGVAFNKMWIRKSNVLAYMWGVSPQTELYERVLVYEDKKNSLMQHWFIKYFISFTVTFVMLNIALFVMVCFLNLQGYLKEERFKNWIERDILYIPFLAKWAAPGAIFDPEQMNLWPFVPIVIRAGCIFVLNAIYRSVALVLTDLERHPTAEEAEKSMIVKRFIFEAFDCYSSLFYLAFIQRDVIALRIELLGLYGVDCIRRIITESVIPYFERKMSMKKQSFTKKARSIGDIKKWVAFERTFTEYAAFDDYLEMVIEYGYIVLFASCHPLSSILSLFCNLIEMKSDLFKLTHGIQKPLPRRSRGIGVWLTFLQVLSLLSIISNCLIVSLCSKQMVTWFPQWYTPTEKTSDIILTPEFAGIAMGTIFGWEHFFLLCYCFVHYVVPEEPRWLRRRFREISMIRKSIQLDNVCSLDESRSGGSSNYQDLAATIVPRMSSGLRKRNV